MKCTPAECQWSDPWEHDPKKTRCRKPPTPQTDRPDMSYHNGWNFTTTTGGPCVNKRPAVMQEALF